jgi:hypothetical protein
MPDSHFDKQPDEVLIRLYWQRFTKLKVFRARRAPRSTIEQQKAMFRQMRRILHTRGIEDPDKPKRKNAPAN